LNPEQVFDSKTESSSVIASKKSDAPICPVCGSIAVQEKCKVICRSEICRGRVVMNCSEF